MDREVYWMHLFCQLSVICNLTAFWSQIFGRELALCIITMGYNVQKHTIPAEFTRLTSGENVLSFLLVLKAFNIDWKWMVKSV